MKMNMEHRASVKSLLNYLKERNNEVQLNYTSTIERIELSSLEEQLIKISSTNNGSVTLEEFCNLLVKQALPDIV